MLTRNINKERRTSAGPNEDSIVMFFFHKFVDSDRPAHHHIGLELNPHGLQLIDLLANDVLGKTKLGNSVDEYAAQFMKGLEHPHLVPFLNQITSYGEARRTAAHDRHPFARSGHGWQANRSHTLFVIGDEALE